MRNRRSSSSLKSLALIILPFITFLLGWNLAINSAEKKLGQENLKPVSSNLVETKKPKFNFKIQEFDLGIVDEVYDLIEKNYVDAKVLDESKIKYGLARGLVSALDDPYSVFMSPKENKNFQDSMEGKLEGIGAELTLKNEFLTIVSPLKDSPASKAGLLPEDIIVKIEGEPTAEMTLEEAVLKIRGEKGTEVVLTIARQGEEEKDYTILRDRITVDSVTWEMQSDKIGLISLNQFGENTTKEFYNAIEKLQLQGAKAIILDLRFNGGGYLTGSVDIVSAFVSEGEVVSVQKRKGQGTEQLSVDGNVKIAKLPLVVLINKGSASASEIVAGAIRDHKRGFLMGETSFGKGTVQEVIPLSDGSSLRITIAKWFTPSGENITDTGIKPDQEVKMTLEDYLEDRDPQMDAAIEFLKEKIK